MEGTKFYPLGEILEIVQSTGLDVSYAYEDLVFSEHNVFIIRFDADDSKKIWLYYNQDCESSSRSYIESQISRACRKKSIKLQKGGLYALNPLDDKEEIRIQFLHP